MIPALFSSQGIYDFANLIASNNPYCNSSALLKEETERSQPTSIGKMTNNEVGIRQNAEICN